MKSKKLNWGENTFNIVCANQEEINKRISLLMSDSRTSTYVLADATGISNNTAFNAKYKLPQTDTLIRIASYFNTTVEFLNGRNDMLGDYQIKDRKLFHNVLGTIPTAYPQQINSNTQVDFTIMEAFDIDIEHDNSADVTRKLVDYMLAILEIMKAVY